MRPKKDEWQFVLRLPHDTAKMLKDAAAADERSINSFLEILIFNSLQKKNPEQINPRFKSYPSPL